MHSVHYVPNMAAAAADALLAHASGGVVYSDGWSFTLDFSLGDMNHFYRRALGK